VLVQVHSAGCNRADLVQLAGRYPAPPGSPADIPGLEFAGVVVAHGEGVTSPQIGSRVFGIAGGGGQAELLVVPAAQCAPVPDALDDVAAGGVPEVFITAHDALRTQAEAVAGDIVLVHAAGSGVGTAAVQLAHAIGCTTVGTSRTEHKLEHCRVLGLDHAVVAPRDLDPIALADAITAAGGPVDVTVDLVGGPYVVADVRAAATKGRIVLVASQAGARAELEIGTVMAKRLRIHGTVLRSRAPDEKAAATAAFTRDVVPLLARRVVVPVIAETFVLDDAEAAYARLAADAVFGKVVLLVG
jgi:NADPH:quinone reductase-like Zn-dependent oxidoreductase